MLFYTLVHVMEYTFGVNNKLDDIYNSVLSFLNFKCEDKILKNNQYYFNQKYKST